MSTPFQEALATIRDQQDFLKGCNEAKTIKHAIDPLLQSARWNVHKHEEVYDQYLLPNGKRVDYSLKIDGKSRIFLEAKEWDKPLTDNNRNQLHGYCLTALKDEQMAANCDVPRLAILTNGRIWRFYVAPEKNNHKLRQMDPEIDIVNRDKTWVQNYFMDFLSRNNVRPGEPTEKTLKAARKRHKDFEKRRDIWTRLHRAWDRLASANSHGEQRRLVLHFAHSQGIEAEEGLVQAFLKQNHYSLFNEVAVTPPRSPSQKPTSFTFEGMGNSELVQNWADLLRKVCAILYDHHPDSFSKSVLSIGQAWISPVGEMKNGHEQIGESDVAVSVHGNAKSLEDRCRKIVERLGYAKESLIINRSEA